MTPVATETLAEQRLALRKQLQVQREQIARTLDPESATGRGYPRSMTMRFLLSRPGLAVKLIAGLATLLFGSRLFRS